TIRVARGSPGLETGEKNVRPATRFELDHHPPRRCSPPRARLFEPTASQGLPGGQLSPPLRAPGREGRGRLLVTTRQACPQPKGFGRNLRSKTRWFTGFCNSH
ncbi:hypothetical protein PIB30_111193, partial [Stylosanthes scabra]|nr:hypothetical protein [Stylosanthes scabra]